HVDAVGRGADEFRGPLDGVALGLDAALQQGQGGQGGIADLEMVQLLFLCVFLLPWERPGAVLVLDFQQEGHTLLDGLVHLGLLSGGQRRRISHQRLLGILFFFVFGSFVFGQVFSSRGVGRSGGRRRLGERITRRFVGPRFCVLIRTPGVGRRRLGW